MKYYNYIARQVPFGELEQFLNEMASAGYWIVSAMPSGLDFKERAEGEGSASMDTFYVIMAQKSEEYETAQRNIS